MVESLLLSGAQLERNLSALAAFSQDSALPGEVTRLALTPEEIESRFFLATQMEQAGMEVQHHPLTVIGTYKGTNPDLKAIATGSHFDTVPAGGIYDGNYGVLAAIQAVKVFKQADLRFPKDIKVIAFTGEESSRFNTALFGSDGIFKGLTEEKLASRRDGDISLKEALQQAFPDTWQEVLQPLFFASDIGTFIELHIEQANKLAVGEKDVGIINAIAAPDRYLIQLGESIKSMNLSTNSIGLQIKSLGKGGHSGATPMGPENRADGLQPVATLLMILPRLAQRYGVKLLVKGVEIKGQALNKISAETIFDLALTGDNIEQARQDIEKYLTAQNKRYGQGKKYPKFES